MPRDAGIAIAVQIIELELPFAAWRQVAEVGIELQPAQCHVARLQRQIVVRRKIEIVRHRYIETGAIPLRELRRQKTALALVVDRKRQPRRVEYRHALELEPHAPRRTEAFIDIERHLVGHELPIGVVHRTGRKAHAR